jgi:hypothetical protein
MIAIVRWRIWNLPLDSRRLSRSPRSKRLNLRSVSKKLK